MVGDPDLKITPLTEEKKKRIWEQVERTQQQRKERKRMKKQEIVQKRVTAVTLASDLDELVKASTDTYLSARSGSMADTIALAMATSEIEKALTPDIMKPLMSLQGKAFGFQTDIKYPEAIVKECAVQALLQGVPMAGNCVNIIAKRAYITKEGFTFLIDQLQACNEISHFKYDLGTPFGHEVRGKTSKGNDIIVAKVQVTASWRQRNNKQEISTTFACKGDAWSSEDSYQGKAERKLKRRCYERMKGISFAMESDIDDEDFEMSDLDTADVQETQPEPTGNPPETPEEPISTAGEQTGATNPPTEPEVSDSPAVDSGELPLDEDLNEGYGTDEEVILDEELRSARRSNIKAFADACRDLDVDPTKINHLSVEQKETLLSELQLREEQ
jgi:hypothetical protein